MAVASNGDWESLCSNVSQASGQILALGAGTTGVDEPF